MEREQLKEMYEKYNLEPADIFVIKFGAKGIPIITRTGVEKIQSRLGISVSLELQYHSEDLKTAIIKAVGKLDNTVIETFGEVSPSNCKQNYPIAIAEKRALARVVLKLSGAYSEGIFSEDESEDFKQK